MPEIEKTYAWVRQDGMVPYRLATTELVYILRI